MNPAKENIPADGTKTHQTEAQLSQFVTTRLRDAREALEAAEAFGDFSYAREARDKVRRSAFQLKDLENVTFNLAQERDELLALLKESLTGCTQTEFRDWKARAESAIERAGVRPLKPCE